MRNCVPFPTNISNQIKFVQEAKQCDKTGKTARKTKRRKMQQQKIEVGKTFHGPIPMPRTESSKQKYQENVLELCAHGQRLQYTR